MDHPSSDTSSSNTLQASIEKLFGISNLATTLSLQIREVATVIIGAIQEIDPTLTPTGMAADDFDVIGQMTPRELMVLANLEHTRTGLIASWKHVESEKERIIQQAKTRITGDAGQ